MTYLIFKSHTKICVISDPLSHGAVNHKTNHSVDIHVFSCVVLLVHLTRKTFKQSRRVAGGE